MWLISDGGKVFSIKDKRCGIAEGFENSQAAEEQEWREDDQDLWNMSSG